MAAGTHHVEYDVALLGETTPVGNGKRGGKSGHAGCEVIFSSAFSPFDWVCVVHVGRHVLKFSVLAGDEVLNVT